MAASRGDTRLISVSRNERAGPAATLTRETRSTIPRRAPRPPPRAAQLTPGRSLDNLIKSEAAKTPNKAMIIAVDPPIC